MGYRELMLLLAGLVLLSLLMVQVNTSIVEGSEAMQDLVIQQMAMTLAQQIIEEAKSKKFDAVVGVLDPSTYPETFTDPPPGLGHLLTESYPNFNDVDDYEGLNENITINGITFNVQVQVRYVRDTAPDVSHNNETYFKRMRVRVTGLPWFSNTIEVKHIFSYYGMNN